MIRALQVLSAIGFAAVLGLFTVLALAPPETDFGIFASVFDDKVGHFLAFFVFTTLAVATFARLHVFWISFFLALAGSALELGQHFSGREISIEDMAANLLGLAAGLFPIFAYRLRLAVKRQLNGNAAQAEPHRDPTIT